MDAPQRFRIQMGGRATDEQAACESVVRAAQTLELAFSVEEEGGEQVVKITKDEELWLLRE